MAPMCLYAFLTASGHAPNKDILENILPDLQQGQSEVQPQALGSVSYINSFIHQELSAYFCHIRTGAVMDEEELRTHYIVS